MRKELDPRWEAPDPADRTSAGNRLVEEWQEGRDREETFRRIFETYYRLVHNFFLKRGFPPDECQDLTQETFLKVHRGLPTFRSEARFETWLFQIAIHILRNNIRVQATQKREAQEVPLDLGNIEEPVRSAIAEPQSLEGILADERSQVLYLALAGLPAQMRKCVELRVHQDLRYREIAEVMHVSIDTVKAHLYQARQQLKAKLSDYFDVTDL